MKNEDNTDANLDCMVLVWWRIDTPLRQKCSLTRDFYYVLQRGRTYFSYHIDSIVPAHGGVMASPIRYGRGE